ncbi:cold-shock protein, partial [Micromonospora noduli]
PPRPGSGWGRALPHWWPPVAPPAPQAEPPGGLSPRHGVSPRVYGASMQGTVASYDAATRSGVLLLDDGTEMRFPARAFDASGLRLLRLGQRVRIDTDPDGEVVRVTLPTMI